MPACHAGGREFESRPHRQNKRSASRCVFILALRTFRNRAYRGRLPPNPCGLRPTQRKSLRFYFGVADIPQSCAYRGRLPPNPCGLRPTQRKSLRFYFGVADNHGYSFLLDTKTGYRSHFLAVSGVINLS